MKIGTILVPIDFSEQSRTALEYAVALGRDSRARLLLVHVKEPPIFFPPEGVGVLRETIVDKPCKLLDEMTPQGSDSMCERHVLVGDPADEIVRLADEEQVDLIVMGTHGRTGLPHLLMGSVAEKVVRRSGRPVLTIKLPSQPATAAVKST
jgi:nucleotide-binding universal stress UspA family protein